MVSLLSPTRGTLGWVLEQFTSKTLLNSIDNDCLAIKEEIICIRLEVHWCRSRFFCQRVQFGGGFCCVFCFVFGGGGGLGGRVDPYTCLFDLILNVPSTIFQLYRDGSS